MLTKVLRFQIFVFCKFKYVVYVMLCMQRQSNNYIYEACKSLLILVAKSATTNEFQQLSNKAKTKTNKTYNEDQAKKFCSLKKAGFRYSYFTAG